MDENLKNNTIKILQRDQDQFKDVYKRQSDLDAPEVMEKVEVVENDDGTWSKNTTEVKSNLKDERIIGEKEDEVENDAKTLQEFSAVADRKILEIAGEIDVKKELIVTLSAAAGVVDCDGLPDSCGSTQQGTVGHGFTAVNMKKEVEYIMIYNKMAGPDVDFGAENPFEPDNTSALTTPYVGYGYSNVAESMVYKDVEGVATGLKTDGSGAGISTMGRFDLSGTGSQLTGSLNCTELKNLIATTYNEIIALRIEANTLRGHLNIVKKKKADKELTNWGCKNMRVEVESGQTAENSTISAVDSLFADL